MVGVRGKGLCKDLMLPSIPVITPADGHLELYKSTRHYDGNPGREQHGYQSREDLPL